MKHTITHTGNDWVLKIWEPALPSKSRTLPFLYKAQFRLPSEEEAIAVLQRYQEYYEQPQPVPVFA